MKPSKLLPIVALASLSQLFIGCASTDNSLRFKLPPADGEPVHTTVAPPTEESVQLQRIQDELAMSRSIEQLGFEERPYKGKYFSVLYFRMQCRATEGTVNYMSEAELRPLRSDNLIWMIGKDKGTITTDGSGYGQIRFIASEGSKNKRLILKSGGDILGLKIRDVSRFIVPNYWCNPELQN